MKRAAWAWLAFVALLAVLGATLWAECSAMLGPRAVLEAPGAAHLFGTDALGRDLLARVAAGSAVSLSVALVAVALSVLIGTAVGAAAGALGGWPDRILMRLTDLMLCFPVFFLMLAVIAIVGPGLWNIMIIIGATSWMGTARLVRAEVMSLKERQFILASRALGAGPWWIALRHLVPNAMRPVWVSAVLGISAAILTETGLSFLGIGVEPPTPSWGNILMEGRSAIGVAWWLLVIPGVFILLTALAVNILGERAHER